MTPELEETQNMLISEDEIGNLERTRRRRTWRNHQ
jgi:hypothetical protein